MSLKMKALSTRHVDVKGKYADEEVEKKGFSPPKNVERERECATCRTVQPFSCHVSPAGLPSFFDKTKAV